MPNRITPDLDALLGKSIVRICPQGFHDFDANHCAHFISHAGGYRFGFLCHNMPDAETSTPPGVGVRVQEIFPHCPTVGKWDDLPKTDDDLLVFITARRHVNLATKTIQNVPKKHIGILRAGQVFHYSNGEEKVVRQTPDAVRGRFRAAYSDSTVDLFFGTLPATTRGLVAGGRSRGPAAAASTGLSLKLTRSVFTKNSTIGDLTVAGNFECHILEDPVRPAKIAGHTAIPAGSYSVIVSHSPKFGRDLPLLQDVPNFEGIRIHPGNTAADTEGCLLPGRSKARDAVGESRAAFAALFDKIKAARGRGERVQMEIVESGASPFSRSRGRGVAAAAGSLGSFRVVADPLQVRSSADAASTENVIGIVDFGQIVAGTPASAAPGWMEIKPAGGKRGIAGLVPWTFLEPVAKASKSPNRGGKPKAKTKPKAKAKQRAARGTTRGRKTR
jgi:hypothetical protein